MTKTLRDYILVWKREIIYQECKRRVPLIKDDVILHHGRQDENMNGKSLAQWHLILIWQLILPGSDRHLDRHKLLYFILLYIVL